MLSKVIHFGRVLRELPHSHSVSLDVGLMKTNGPSEPYGFLHATATSINHTNLFHYTFHTKHTYTYTRWLGTPLICGRPPCLPFHSSNSTTTSTSTLKTPLIRPLFSCICIGVQLRLLSSALWPGTRYQKLRRTVRTNY